jgi:long-chain acyl-CoA synthetase
LGALDRDALLKHEKTGALYTAQLAEYSSSFRGYEKCKKFMFANEDFSTENGMLTPTLKLKRRVVTKHYMDQIDALYA